MNTIDAIMNRKSIRKYTGKKISDEDIMTILKAGMAGPSCVNSRDWSFVAVTDKETLSKMADGNGKYAGMLKEASLGILVCGDMDLAHKPAPEYWVIDGSIACQNMILAATDLGIGSVWLGTWPQMDRVEAQKKILDLPDNLIPHSIIAFGYPGENPDKSSKPEIELGKVKFIK